jgi:hypothetical protein
MGQFRSTVQDTGPLIHRVLNILTRRMQLSSDFPPLHFLWRFGDNHGTLVFMPDFGSSTRPRILIRKAKMLPGTAAPGASAVSIIGKKKHSIHL